jgi:sec-independent protein translocase protein TatA
MPNIGGWEILIVVVLALIIFGPKKLPELGSSLGKSIRGFKKGLKDNKEEIVNTVAQVKEAAAIDEIKATVAEVREAAGVNDVKAAVAEVRQAAGVDDVKAAVKEIRDSVNVKDVLSSPSATPTLPTEPVKTDPVP